LTLAADRAAARVADVGCGTGTLTVALALQGHVVTGADPNPAFLAIAAAKEGAERVRWVRGTSGALVTGSFDMVLMTSHVAQEFLSDEEWLTNLNHIHRALVPGGIVAFDTRDPAARAWEYWTSGDVVQLLPADWALHSSTTLRFVDDVARFEGSVVVTRARQVGDGEGGAELSIGGTAGWARWGYRFRSPGLVRESLEVSGFILEHMYGGWHHEPVGQGTGEIVVVARSE
jgi:SAM-dependent methyltransferase